MKLWTHTARLSLRPLCVEDKAAFLFAAEASAEAHRPWIPRPAPGFGPLWQFQRSLDAQRQGEGVRLLARRLSDGDAGPIVAMVSLTAVARGYSDSANAGWSVTAGHTGQGFATEAVSGMLDVAFDPDGMNLHRVACGIMPHNAPSLRVAEKAGFRREGYALKLLKIAGEWQDHVLLAKLADEHGPVRSHL